MAFNCRVSYKGLFYLWAALAPGNIGMKAPLLALTILYIAREFQIISATLMDEWREVANC